MKNKPVLTLDDVKKIAGSRRSRSGENNWAVTISVVDDGGHLLWLQRLSTVRRRCRRGSARKRRSPPRSAVARLRFTRRWSTKAVFHSLPLIR